MVFFGGIMGMTFKLPELIIVIVLILISLVVIGPRRLGMFFGAVAKSISNLGNQNLLNMILGIVGLVGGYLLGSIVLPMLTYTSWERHVVETYSSNYSSGLQSAYSETAFIGGVVGAILFGVLGLIAARLLRK